MAYLIQPAADPEIRASFLAAMREFEAERGYADAGGLTVEDLSGDSCLTQYTQNLREGTSLRIGTEPLRTCEWWWVEPSYDHALDYLGRGCLRHHPRRGASHLLVSVRPSRRREGHGTAILAVLLHLAYSSGINPARAICSEEDAAARKMIVACGGVIDQHENGWLRYRLYTNR